MTCASDTAYPRLKVNPTTKELLLIYTPTSDELDFANVHARSPTAKLGLLVLLKTFQRLGYFPIPSQVPVKIVEHIATTIDLIRIPSNFSRYNDAGSRIRHVTLIRQFTGVTPFDDKAHDTLTQSVTDAAALKDDIADIINVAIEELIRQRYELPGFSLIDRAARKARLSVNVRYHRLITSALGIDGCQKIDALCVRATRATKSLWDAVKKEPKSPTVSHIRDFVSHLRWLRKYDLGEEAFQTIPNIKIRQFAAEARALDAASMRDLAHDKRYALAATLIRLQTGRALDDLAEMLIRRIQRIHRHSKEALNQYHLSHVEKTKRLVTMLHEIALISAEHKEGEHDAATKLNAIFSILDDPKLIIEQCEAYRAHADNNYLAFLPRFFKGARCALFDILESLPLTATSHDKALLNSVAFAMANRKSHAERLNIADDLDLSWIPDKWWPLITESKIRTEKEGEKPTKILRRYFEICLFSQIMVDLKSGDLAVKGGDRFADYRNQLISWDEYKKDLTVYCEQVGLPSTAEALTTKLRLELSNLAADVDEALPRNQGVRVENGEIILSKIKRQSIPPELSLLDRLLDEKIPKVNIPDILVDTDQWVGWTKNFGPLSGHKAKIQKPQARYIATTFCYGCNLGPSQTSRSMKDLDRRQISLINQRHMTSDSIEEATVRVINAYNGFILPKIWGTGKRAAADGTKWDLYEQNLLSEYHVRYGGYGGIGYYHVSDTYIALFSHFIPCGVWEAVHIIDGLLQNSSDIQPDTLHGDTQAQSTPVFALAYLLGIKLMPRIRNWKDVKFYRPEKGIHYKNIDSLFDDAIDWQLIETHFPDMLRVVMSIKAGKITASTILRRLGTYSRKNKLYFAFRELGRVVRTMFLLNYIHDIDLRRIINATTNKCEAYNGFTQWVGFGGDGTISQNDREEQRKVIKYNHLVASLIILHTVNGMTKALGEIEEEGHVFDKATLEALAPYRTEHINRFGDYTLNLDRNPGPITYDWKTL